MHGFRVTLADGAEQVVEATAYEVSDAGALVVRGGGTIAQSFDAGAWVDVQEVGDRLCDQWPYPNFENLLSAPLGRMARLGSLPRGVRGEDFLDWRLNDFDALVAAIVTTDGIEIGSSDPGERRLIEEVRATVAEEFGVRRSG